MLASPTPDDNRRTVEFSDHPAVLLSDGLAGSLLVAPARLATARTVNLMATHGRGLICHAMDAYQMMELGIALLPSIGRAPDAWRFGTSIEATHGISTGIAAEERALTLRTAAAPGAGASDIAQPGHIIPVLVDGRCDVLTGAARLVSDSGQTGGAVICTILDTEGAIATPKHVQALAVALSLECHSPHAVLSGSVRQRKGRSAQDLGINVDSAL